MNQTFLVLQFQQLKNDQVPKISAFRLADCKIKQISLATAYLQEILNKVLVIGNIHLFKFKLPLRINLKIQI